MTGRTNFISYVLPGLLFSIGISLAIYGFLGNKSAEQENQECFAKHGVEISETQKKLNEAEPRDIVVMTDGTPCVITAITKDAYHCKIPTGATILRSRHVCTGLLGVNRIVHDGKPEYLSLAAKFMQ